MATMKWWPSARLIAGCTMSTWSPTGAGASSSPQYGTRVPLVVSSSTTGASAASDEPMSVEGAIPVRSTSRSGTNARIAEPGEKPSARF
jgi:hypothetical protein